jgi:hypothetical protein
LYKVAEISSHGESSYHGSVFIAYELNVAKKRKSIDE